MLESVNMLFLREKLISTNAAGLNVQPRKCCEWSENGYCILPCMQDKENVNSSERRCKNITSTRISFETNVLKAYFSTELDWATELNWTDEVCCFKVTKYLKIF